ncbi:hypothetical protein AB9P05_03960 [Roseivirga sp. BDSF3-8]|uniref:hypothetical protein n=1 Tax=Roseivirga sp. BDSF3-8 TaxID=3241598 RepID=UPI0035327DC8
MINKENKNLEAALQPYQEGLDLDDEQRLNWLQDNVKGGFVNVEHLKLELEEALSDSSFDWIGFAESNSLLLSPSSYNNEEIINYVKLALMDFVYPENVLTQEQISKMQIDVVGILNGYSVNEGWMFSYDLYELLKKKENYQDLEYFDLWKLNFYKSNIERRPIVQKYQEIGYLRHKKNQL